MDLDQMSSSNTSCVYKQVFNVTPLLGGFTTFDTDLSKSTFNYIPYADGTTIQANDNTIVVTTKSGKSMVFQRALVVFRDVFRPNVGITGCVTRVEVNEVAPTVVLNSGEDRVVLSTGTLILTNGDRLVSVNFRMPSRSNIRKISQKLHTFILDYNRVSSTDSNQPHAINNCGYQNFNIITSPSTTTSTNQTITLKLIPLSPTDLPPTYKFESWYVSGIVSSVGEIKPAGPDNVFNIPLEAPGSQSNIFRIGYNAVSASGSRIVYSTFKFRLNISPYTGVPCDFIQTS